MMSRVNMKAGAYGGTKMGGHITDRSVATHCTEAQPPTHQHLSIQPDREAGPKRSQGSTNGSTFHDPWMSNGLKGLEGLIQAPQAFGSELSSKKGASGLTASDNMHKQLAVLMSDIDEDLEQTASAVARCKAR